MAFRRVPDPATLDAANQTVAMKRETPAQFVTHNESIWMQPQPALSDTGVDGVFGGSIDSQSPRFAGQAFANAKKWLDLYRNGDFGGGGAAVAGDANANGGMT